MDVFVWLKGLTCQLHDAVIVFQKQNYCLLQEKHAGGVATSGLEMSQNSLRLSWTSEEVDEN
jgi:glutamate dehydrogenase (NADP+)